ncbi:MAG: acylphosphatase [Methanothrix sp.]|nr:acylphosphatase [Methanothrix sp.]
MLDFYMMKLTAFVSGKVQEVGYRARIVDIANAFGLKGMVENQKDGRVKIIAEGEDEKLKWFESAIDIKNTLIYVSSIEKVYSPACNEFDNFGKLVLKGETDTRLDTAAAYLKELVSVVKNMNDNLGGKMDQMLGKQDELLDEVRDINGKFDRVLENDIVELKNDMAEVKAALREKGII